MNHFQYSTLVQFLKLHKYPFSALTLLVGGMKGIQSVKNLA